MSLLSCLSMQGADPPSSGSVPEAQLLDLDFLGAPDVPVSAWACAVQVYVLGPGSPSRDLNLQKVGWGHEAAPVIGHYCAVPGASLTTGQGERVRGL